MTRRAAGLWQNGRLWWMRVLGEPRSTGTADLRVANRIVAMVESLRELPAQRPWLERVLRREVTLLELYTAHSAGTLGSLASALAARVDDVDLAPWVDRWVRESLSTRDVAEETRREYERQVRVLIPGPLARSAFTEDYVKGILFALRDPRTGETLSGSTRRRYLAPWSLFVRWARKRVPLAVNPLEDVDEWMPSNNSAKATYWDHPQVLEVLDRMAGEARLFMTLVFGTGMEYGAAEALLGRHARVGGDRLIVAPGSKTEAREERTIFVSEWAWARLEAHVRSVLPRASLWRPETIAGSGVHIRHAFYEAQLAAKLIDEPPRSPRTGKRMWGKVHPHTIHDARHTYAVNRLLGLDGEPRMDIKTVAHQLGHADEQMVMKIYSKANVAERLRLIELAGARRKA